VIDYSDWNAGHLLVVPSVPVRKCEENGQRFFQAQVARSLEKLFQADLAGQFGCPLGRSCDHASACG
jgi:hypothetical protein